MNLGLKRGTAELAEHDPEWEILAAKTINRLWYIFGSIAMDIQHFGSTAIKNIKAKPIIDIAVALVLVKKFKNDREAYRENKNYFIEQMLKYGRSL